MVFIILTLSHSIQLVISAILFHLIFLKL